MRSRACAFAVALSLLAATAHADARRGHREKVAGATLIVVGSALALAGQILFIAAATVRGANLAHCGPMADCSPPSLNPALVPPAAALVAVGGASILAGIPVYVVGGREINQASAPTVALANISF